MKYSYIYVLICLFFIGCVNKVEVTKAKMDEDFKSELSPYLEKFASSIMFIQYANPENYWYPDGTTPKEVLNDEFRVAMAGMKKLEGRLNEVQAINSSVQSAIDSFSLAIESEKQNIRQIRLDLEKVNSLFGFGMYGGASALYDFGSMLGGGNGNAKPIKLPDELEQQLDNVVSELMLSFRLDLLPQIKQFETNSIGDHKLNNQQQQEIRDYLEGKIREDIALHFGTGDSDARDDMVSNLLEAYNNEWHISSE